MLGYSMTELIGSTYTIIKKHAGRITVGSPPGEGAVFTVLLPAQNQWGLQIALRFP